MKLSEIHAILGLEFSQKDADIRGLNSLKNAQNDEMSYCDGDKNLHLLSSSKAGAVLISQNMLNSAPKDAIAVVVENPHLAFAILSKYFAKPLFYPNWAPQIDPSAVIMQGAHVGQGAKIGARTVVMHGAYIGDNVSVGEDCVIHPNVVIYNNCSVGDDCVLNANCVIGSDGFGFAHTKTGEHVKIYHNGYVKIGNHVEIGACTTIDRGVFEPTIIADYVKIDNLVQIGHNCELGYGTILVSQVGLAGSTKLGRNVVMGGQSGSGGHLEIGDFAQIAARGGVAKSIPGGKNYGGYPLMELREWFRAQAWILRSLKIKR